MTPPKKPRFEIELVPGEHIIVHAKQFIVDGEHDPKSRDSYEVSIDKFGKISIERLTRRYG